LRRHIHTYPPTEKIDREEEKLYRSKKGAVVQSTGKERGYTNHIVRINTTTPRKTQVMKKRQRTTLHSRINPPYKRGHKTA